MKRLIVLVCFVAFGVVVSAQSDSSNGTFWKPIPRNYEVKQAVEIESLFPMFFYGGFHAAVGYRYEKFRLRFSVINSGTYDCESAGFTNSSPDFKRFYKTSPGVFFGYNIWKNLEVYGYLESHTFAIEQSSTGIRKDIHSIDYGPAVGYQIFIGRYVYVQPGFHLYFRQAQSLDFNGVTYHIPNADYSFVVRIGVRLWSAYK